MIALDVSEQLLSEEVVEEEVRKEVSDRLEEFINWVAKQPFEPDIRSEALSVIRHFQVLIEREELRALPMK